MGGCSCSLAETMTFFKRTNPRGVVAQTAEVEGAVRWSVRQCQDGLRCVFLFLALMYAWTDWNPSQEQEISGVKYAGWSPTGCDGGEVFPEACVVEHVVWWFAARTGRVLEDLENAIG
jgi:hypothetical protein